MLLKSHTAKRQSAKLGVLHLYRLGLLQKYKVVQSAPRKLFLKI